MNKKVIAAAVGLVAVVVVGIYASGAQGGLQGFLKIPQNIQQKSWTLSSNDVTFLNTLNGSWSNREVTLKNNSLHRMNFSWSELPDSDVISLVNSDNFSLAAGATKTIRFKFAPTENINDIYNASAVLSGDGKSKTISLEGEGQEAFHVSPTEVNFQRTVVGSTSRQKIEIENFSGNPIRFVINNPRSVMYRIDGGDNFDNNVGNFGVAVTVDANSSRDVWFSFTPRVVGNWTELQPSMVQAPALEDYVDITFNSTGVAR